MIEIEDDRFTAADAKREHARMRRADAIEAQSRKVTVTLAPGEMHPRDRIASLEKRLAEVEEERQEMARRIHHMNTLLRHYGAGEELEDDA